jgi:glutathione S-transferase
MNLDYDCDWKTANAKLEYLQINGRGGFIRSMLYWKGLPFEDIKIDHKSWYTERKTSGDYEFNQLPVFEFNGIRMAQSGAIALWLAKQWDLLGNNPYDEYLHTSLLYSLEDILPKCVPSIVPMNGNTPERMEAIKKEFLEVHGPFYLKIWENRFLKHGSKYAVGDKFGLADFVYTYFLYNIYRNPKRMDWEPLLLEHAPNLAKYIERIHDNELAPFFSKGYNYDSQI